MQIESQFRSRVQVQLRFKDIDAMGHVNNANHLSFFELARVHYFNTLLGTELNWNRQGIILARIEIDYKRPLLLSEQVEVDCRVSRLGNSSFEMEYRIVARRRDGEPHIAATGKSVQVCFDYEQGVSIAMPAHWREKVLAFESGGI
ncbi:MAG: acyl-CoA thioesterase [Sphingobacteriales bacterium]|jgi:acyl-CoA thioester hydrolase|nr:acyl-CoA thioesterase [Sphingobacteriales bacterium]